VFTTELKPEPSDDVRLELVQSGVVAAGTATLSGRATAVDDPGLVLGRVPATAVSTDGRFDLAVLDFVIPPGQEPLLPDGGEGQLALVAALVDADLFCGTIDFHLLVPIDLHQSGEFAAYREGVRPLAGAGCAP